MSPRLPICFRRIFPALMFLGSSMAQVEVHAAPSLQLTNIAPTTGGLRLDWTSVGAGTNYTVQSRDVLGEEGLWVSPPEQAWPIPLAQWIDRRPVTEPARFYRVLAVPAAQRGKVLSVSAPTTYTKFIIGLIFAGQGIPITPQYAVTVRDVGYETITPDGARAGVRHPGAAGGPQRIAGAGELPARHHPEHQRRAGAGGVCGSRVCHHGLRGASQVQLIDPMPTADHGGCVLPSLLNAKAWFDTLRQ